MSGQNILGAASISPQIIKSAQLGTSDAAIYTVPAATSVKIATASICNTTASVVSVWVSLVQSGGTIGDGTHRVINSYALAGNDSLSLRDLLSGAMLGPGDAIAGYASTASAIDFVVTGTVHA
ncbi:hypothetical protein [Arthrobacter bambusae]|uniref:hypothetical protein n=1 Tax=Arthrobacter bambusae TaxID=1338426 RepID=UPI002788CDA1|nr:hypothetical protein [Arthrobacter bambusae]MDQ0030172.1 hypothetical protein [Arthrobacter bambusae]MDQ0097854.1 hypothetical protein [Arthrobacter bambusae]